MGDGNSSNVELTVCLISHVLSWLLVAVNSSTSEPSGKQRGHCIRVHVSHEITKVGIT